MWLAVPQSDSQIPSSWGRCGIFRKPGCLLSAFKTLHQEAHCLGSVPWRQSCRPQCYSHFLCQETHSCLLSEALWIFGPPRRPQTSLLQSCSDQQRIVMVPGWPLGKNQPRVWLLWQRGGPCSRPVLKDPLDSSQLH